MGALAHRLWVTGEFPKEKCCANNFYVLEEVMSDLITARGSQWEIRAAQSSRNGAMRYMDNARVLVDVTNAKKT